MPTCIHSFRNFGSKAVPVIVECHITDGIGIHLVGLADVAVKESLLRTITAIEAAGFHVSGKKIIFNVAPADLRKEGLGFDLPMALAYVVESGQHEMPDFDKYVVAGELGLDGSVRFIPGWMQALEVAEQTGKGLILPYETAKLAAAVDRTANIYGVKTLAEAIEVLSDSENKVRYLSDDADLVMPGDSCAGAWDSIRGNFGAKRALEIAAAGGHGVLLVGPEDSDKEKLAKALCEILPSLSSEQADEVQEVYSVTGNRIRYGQRPFRSVMYWPTLTELIGGGSGMRGVLPGIVSRAHNGVLYLDKFAEMPNAVKETLRGPLEDGKVSIRRLHGIVEYPAKFLPVLGTLPCPCGHHGESEGCTCTATQRRNYIAKLSGPVYDRVAVQAWAHSEPQNEAPTGDSAQVVAARVARARDIQMARQGRLNNDLHNGAVCQESFVGEAAFEMLNNIVAQMGISVRAYAHTIRIARTIADLEGAEAITPQHICEAVTYRFLDRPAV